jgi:hypothetical protein
MPIKHTRNACLPIKESKHLAKALTLEVDRGNFGFDTIAIIGERS